MLYWVPHLAVHIQIWITEKISKIIWFILFYQFAILSMFNLNYEEYFRIIKDNIIKFNIWTMKCGQLLYIFSILSTFSVFPRYPFLSLLSHFILFIHVILILHCYPYLHCYPCSPLLSMPENIEKATTQVNYDWSIHDLLWATKKTNNNVEEQWKES